MKKKILISLIMLTIITINLMTVVSFAIISDPTANPDLYNPGELENATELMNIGNVIIGIIQAVGTIVSVGILIMIGIKYMMGSVEEKAEYKETLKSYIIGAILLFATTNIVGIIYNLAKGM